MIVIVNKMKDISDIEDEYKESYEEITERYKTKISSGKNKILAQKEFTQDFKKILSRRNKQLQNYVSHNKDKLLDMPEKKIKKEEKNKVYKAYHIDFRKNFYQRLKMKSAIFWFKLKLFFRGVKYNIFPSKLKFMFFRMGIFFSSFFVDFSNFFRTIKRTFRRVFGRYYDRMKERIVKRVNKVKDYFLKIKEERKKKEEEKKKLKEEEEQKKLEEKKANEEKVEEEGTKEDVSEVKEETN